MAPSRRLPNDPPPDYGPEQELFSVEINHGGFFVDFGASKKYMDCKTDYFDHCEVETWSPLWITDFVQQLGYDPSKVQCFWLLPGMNLDNGLRIIDRDADCLSMIIVVPKFEHFKLYMDHGDIYNEIAMGDICIVGSPPMPAVMSPGKPQDRGAHCYVRCSPRMESKTQKGKLNMSAREVNTAPWTVMSDRQKGLINVVTALFPEAQHRFCVRHLYQNFAKKWKGENLKNKLWAIARSYNELDWKKNMEEMKDLNLEAYEYLQGILYT